MKTTVKRRRIVCSTTSSRLYISQLTNFENGNFILLNWNLLLENTKIRR